MTSKYRNLLPMVLLFAIGGCATAEFAGSQSERRAETMARNGQHQDAAASYIGLAAERRGLERDRLTLLAVEQWLNARDGGRARNALREVQKPAGGEVRWLWDTTVSALYLYEGRPDEALQILEPLSRQPLTLRHRAKTEALRADAWFQKGQPTTAVELYIQRENWLDRPGDIELNRSRLWAGLLVSNPQVMRSAAERSVDEDVRGWLTLGALAASTGQQGIGWGNGVLRWQETNPQHPAMTVLRQMVLPQAGQLDYPRSIALLLQLSGKNATAGKAVQNGFFGAYFAAASGLEDEQRITVYDVAGNGVSAAYARAVEDGAEFVVGPLLRRDVQALAEELMLPVPVLALNYLLDESVTPPGFYQFALAPEDEAIAAASRALADGSLNAVALYPNNDWGRRVMNSFATEFEAAGGRLLDHSSYQTGTQDFSLEIESLMALTQSHGRYKRLRANLSEPLQFDPRRRQDVDFVFLAAEGRAGRLIKSQLKFHYAGDLPVYSTSVIYSMDGRSNRDLNGIMFADAPWIIAPPPWIADYPEIYNEYWPAEKRMGRLHAMGYDAYQLVANLFASGAAATQEIIGATGRLYLTEDGRVHRHLAWARFEGGEPIALPETDTDRFDELLNLDLSEGDGANELPMEWRLQQPNP